MNRIKPDRPERVAVMLTAEEKKFIEECAAKYGITTSAYIRMKLIREKKEEMENDRKRVSGESRNFKE